MSENPKIPSRKLLVRSDTRNGLPDDNSTCEPITKSAGEPDQLNLNTCIVAIVEWGRCCLFFKLSVRRGSNKIDMNHDQQFRSGPMVESDSRSGRFTVGINVSMISIFKLRKL